MLFRSDSLKSNDSLMHENDLENFKVELENERKFR